MEEQIEILYKQSLSIGIGYSDFWEMTIQEIKDYIEAYNKNQKMEYIKLYNIADMISSFTMSRFNGKKIQTFQELFPEFVDEDYKKQLEESNNKYIDAMFSAFAKQHNANRKK